MKKNCRWQKIDRIGCPLKTREKIKMIMTKKGAWSLNNVGVDAKNEIMMEKSQSQTMKNVIKENDCALVRTNTITMLIIKLNA